ncbi:MAG: ferredoxin--NADP reductase [Gemmatimonadota bacterium]
MVAPDKYTAEKILWIHPWAPNLFSFRLTRYAGFRFTPGQFARLGVGKPDPDNPRNPSGTRIVWRAYSIVSASYDEHLEFFSIVVPGGDFTSELSRLKVGDTVFVEKMNYGFLTCDRFEQGKDLWLLATGTGLAPFISILWEPKTWDDYENLILVHSVRYPNELAYRATIEGFREQEHLREQAGKLRYVQVVTRASVPGTLGQRIPALIDSGQLEHHVRMSLDLQRSRVMICGNPEMVTDTRKRLTARGFATSRRGVPGQLAVENYW